MTPTEKMLVEIFGSPTLGTEELAKVFKKASAKVVRDLVSQGIFPVRTYKLGDSKQAPLVADVADVAAVLDAMKAKRSGHFRSDPLRV